MIKEPININYLKSKWEITAIILLIITSIIFVIPRNTDNNSPEETIIQYFTYWINGSITGMNSLTRESIKLMDNTNNHVESVKLLDYAKCTDKEYWREEWYNNPYEYVCVDVAFELHYPDEQDNRVQNWQYYLVKGTEDSHCKIAMYGMG